MLEQIALWLTQGVRARSRTIPIAVSWSVQTRDSWATESWDAKGVVRDAMPPGAGARHPEHQNITTVLFPVFKLKLLSTRRRATTQHTSPQAKIFVSGAWMRRPSGPTVTAVPRRRAGGTRRDGGAGARRSAAVDCRIRVEHSNQSRKEAVRQQQAKRCIHAGRGAHTPRPDETNTQERRRAGNRSRSFALVAHEKRHGSSCPERPGNKGDPKSPATELPDRPAEARGRFSCRLPPELERTCPRGAQESSQRSHFNGWTGSTTTSTTTQDRAYPAACWRPQQAQKFCGGARGH